MVQPRILGGATNDKCTNMIQNILVRIMKNLRVNLICPFLCSALLYYNSNLRYQ